MSISSDFDHTRVEPPEESGILAFLKRYRTPLIAIVTVAVFTLVAVTIFHLTQEVTYNDVLQALDRTPVSAILLALLLTAISFATLMLYDFNALSFMGKKLPVQNVMLTAFSAYAVGNTAGFGALSGGAIRYRAYARLGLSPEEIARVVAFLTLAFGLGLALIASISVLLVAQDIGPTVGIDPRYLRIGGTVALIGICALLVAGQRMGRIRMPDLRTCLLQLVVTAVDIAASASVLFVLLPDQSVGWPTFLAIYSVAVGIGVLSHVPAGLGVFETVILAAVGNAASVDAVLGSLVLYRVIYHVLPLVLAIVIITGSEVWQLTHHPMASSVRRVGARLTPLLLATLSLVLGVMLIFSSVLPTPDANLEFLAGYLPLPILEGAHFLSSLLGLALVIAARGLGQRLDGAWWIAVCCAGAALAFAFLRAIALFEAATLVFFLISLLVSRRLFTRPASLLRQALTPTWMAAMAVVCIGAGVILLFVYRDVEYSHELWWQFEFAEEAPRGLRAMLGLAIASTAFAIFSLLRPARSGADPAGTESLSRAVAITQAQDVADANLVRMGDKSIMFSDEGDAFLMYGVQGRSWIALFDPIGNRKTFPELVWRFVEEARSSGCRAVFYQISPGLLAPCADAGLRAFKLGELAVVDLGTFQLKGGKWANLRQAASKAVRDGLTFSVIDTPDVPAVLDDLQAISDAWLAEHNTREKGFSLGAFDRDYVASQPVAVLRVEEKIVAFATILATDTKAEGSVDLMRFSPDAPKGSMDFLFVRLLEHLRDEGFATFNLGMAPLSGMSNRTASPVWDRIGGAVFEHGERFYNFKGLRAFKSKFHPDWQPRYLAVSGNISPAIALLDSALLIGGGIRGVVGK